MGRLRKLFPDAEFAEDPIEYLCRFLPAQDQAKLRGAAKPEPIAAQA